MRLRGLGLAVLFTACAGAPPTGASARPDDPIELTAEERRTIEPTLMAELQRDPHRYFRYVSHAFTTRECAVAARGPVVNLHGDAHIEQYLVTSLGRGLGDFDDATTGPVEIDLVRLATSIRIVARMRSWDARALFHRFLEGYVAALEDPSIHAPVPRHVTQLEGGFRRDHPGLLAWADGLLEPVGELERARVEVAFSRYVDTLLARRPSLERGAFDVVRLGRHSLGVGSRHHTNYLIRTRGASSSPDDDLILEAKAVATNPGATCLPTAGRADPMRVLVADARLAYAPFRDVGAVEIEGQAYWIHEFVDDYVEVDPRDHRLDEAQMLELLYDMGVQLGLGHPRGISEPYGDELRAELVAFIGDEGASVWAVSGRLLDAIWAGWRRLLADP